MKKQILVIDDDFQDQIESDFMLKTLERFNLEAEFIREGLKGIEILKQNPDKYAAIFLDIIFNKRVDGFMFCDKIREFNLETPIIAVSGNKDANKMLARRRRKGIRYCQGYISKRDWTNPKMAKKIEKILRGVI